MKSRAHYFALAAVWLMILAYGVYFSAYSIQRHRAFLTNASDLGQIDQALWNSSQGRALEFTRRTGEQSIRLTDHVEPIFIPASLVFFIYDNISDPAQMVAQGYTIGVADKLGERGVTYAYAPCCGQTHPPQGYPPAAGTTLQLRPVLFGAANGYTRTFSYGAVVNAAVPETVVSTAVVTSSSPDSGLSYAWSTHYLYVRWQTYLPLVQGESE